MFVVLVVAVLFLVVLVTLLAGEESLVFVGVFIFLLRALLAFAAFFALLRRFTFFTFAAFRALFVWGDLDGGGGDILLAAECERHDQEGSKQGSE